MVCGCLSSCRIGEMIEYGNGFDISSKCFFFWGCFSVFVCMVVLLCVVFDQMIKLWFFYGFDFGNIGFVCVLFVFDFVLVWNWGIFYGLFQ